MRRSGLLREQVEESNIDITPMLDVVFILLIFFIVTATFIKEPGLQVNKSNAKTAQFKPYANILVAIGPNDDIWIDRKKKDVTDVRQTLERLFAENPKGSLIIQTDRGSKSETLMKVMDAARDANIKEIAISAERQ